MGYNRKINNIFKRNDDGMITKKDFLTEFGSLEYRDNEGNTLLHLLAMIQDNISDKKLEEAFEALYRAPIDINSINDKGNTFMHELINNKRINANIKKNIILKATRVNMNTNVNLFNYDTETILHLIIKNYGYNGVRGWEYTLKQTGFNFGSSLFNDNRFTYYLKNYTNANDGDIRLILNMIKANKKYNELNDPYLPSEKFDQMSDSKGNKSRKDIQGIGTILTEKNYFNEPAVGREKEIKEIIIALASEKKSPLLVGPSGVGKTTLVDELAYLIQNKQVPRFLSDKIIVESSANLLVAGTKYRGDFEDKLQRICDYVKDMNGILFLDEIHTMFGTGTNYDDRANDMASMMKNFIDRDGIKVIGTTTTGEYDKYFANNPLKRRFEIIDIEEPNNVLLHNIIMNYFENSSVNRGVSIDKIYDYLDDIIKILINGTGDSHRRYNDKIYNPDLLITIIDMSFAYAVYEDSEYLKIEHIIMALESNNRLYDTTIEELKLKLSMFINRDKTLKRNLIIDFSNYR